MDLHFPNYLLHLLWAVPLIVLLYWRATRLRQRRIRQFVAQAQAAIDVSEARRKWRAGLLVAAIALLLLAAARPHWGTELVQRPIQARDVMVVMDCSRSMLARDVAPSRLRHAKLLVRRLVAECPGDRFGLVAFAGAAFLECPLTQDRSGFLLFLDDLSTSTIPVGGTNVEEALKTAAAGFQAAEGHHRAILLITDGDELTGDAATQAAACRDAGIIILVAGLGDPELGSFLQLDDNSFITDPAGERVRSRLNEPALRQLAEVTGGFYTRSTPVNDGLDQLLAQTKALLPEGRSEQTILRPMERYQLPLALATLLLMIRMGTSERRNGEALAMAAALLMLNPVRGIAAANEGLLELEAPLAVLAAVDSQQRAYAWYNEGVRLQGEGHRDGANQAFEQGLATAGTNKELLAAVCQNLGALAHVGGREMMLRDAMAGKKEPPRALAEASDYYRQSLQTESSEGAGGNLEQALKDIRRYEAMRKHFEGVQRQQDAAQKQVQEAAEAQEQATADSQSRQKQQQARKKTEDAGSAVQQLADAVRGTGGGESADMLEKQVLEKLQRAGREQDAAERVESPDKRQAHQNAASEALKAALAIMGKKSKPGDKDGENGAGQQAGADRQQNGNNQDAGNSDGTQETPPAGGQAGDGRTGAEPAQSGGDAQADGRQGDAQAPLDKEQALRILEANQRRERDLKRLLKERMKQAASAGKVDRDW